MRNVLFFAYYFPPMGASGVQRSLKFSKYLPEFGWNPIVVTPESGLYHTFDESLKKEMIQAGIRVERVKARTPFDFLKSSGASKMIPASDKKAELLRWISSFLFLPDNKRGWIKPAIKRGRALIQSGKIDVILATAPPYSSLIAAAQLKKEFPSIPLIFDFRDDWVESHLIKYPTPLHKWWMQNTEQSCLNEADHVVAINQTMLKSVCSRAIGNVPGTVIPNGFDRNDLQPASKVASPSSRSTVKLLYSGLFYGENQPFSFIESVNAWLEQKPENSDRIELWFQGGVTSEIESALSKLDNKLTVKRLGYKAHKESLKTLYMADVLWFVVGHTKNAEQVVTGKLLEYIGTGKPVLGLVPELGEAASILRRYGPGYICDYHNTDQIIDKLEEVVTAVEDKIIPAVNRSVQDEFERQYQTGQLATVLNKSADSNLNSKPKQTL